MPYPRPSFTFDDNDKDLVKYLHSEHHTFRYLIPTTRSSLSGLDLNDDLSKQTSKLKKLWPRILVNALRFLKYRDTRECANKAARSFFNKDSLGLPALEKLLQAFSDFESLMYGARPEKYRDHIAHVFRVWIIGHGFIQDRLKKGITLEGYPKKDLNKLPTITPDEWLAMWAIVALCHDLGYPLSGIKDVNKRAGEALEKQGLQALSRLSFAFSDEVRPLQDTLIRLMASKLVPRAGGYVNRLQNKYYMKFLYSFDQLEHGLLSALLLGKSLVYFRESDYCHDTRQRLDAKDAKQFSIRREILRAIATHTCDDIYFLKFNTLSFVLYIVDELQSWGRPTLAQLLRGAEMFPNDKVTVRRFRDDEIVIKVKVADDWKKRQPHASAQLKGMARRLRLAVDVADLAGVTLEYAISGDTGGKCGIIVKGGRIDKYGFK